MSTRLSDFRTVPRDVYELPLGHRIRWARKAAKFSHDGLVAAIGRSNRGHIIKIEKGLHVPREDLRDAIADATNVPRELFNDSQEVALLGDTFRGAGGDQPRRRSKSAAASAPADGADVTEGVA